MKVQIQRDQAVWERETFEVEVPDGLEGDELDEAILEATYAFSGFAEDGSTTCWKEILDEAVYGIDTQTIATVNGVEREL